MSVIAVENIVCVRLAHDIAKVVIELSECCVRNTLEVGNVECWLTNIQALSLVHGDAADQQHCH